MTIYEANSQTVAIGISLATFVAFLVRKYVEARGRPPYPPGPPPKFLLGNLLDMPRSRPAITYRNWGRTYGPMAFIQVPGRPILVVNSYKVAVDLLDKRGTIYSDRPPFPMGSLVGVDTGSVLLRFGPIWKQHRKVLNTVLNPGTVKRDYVTVQERKAYEYLNILLERPNEFLAGAQRITGELVTEIAYGAHKDETNDFVEMNDLLTNIISKVLGGYLVDLLPWMLYIPTWFPGAQFKKDAKRWRDQYIGTRDYLYNYVKKRKANNTPMNQSYVLHLLQENENPTPGDEEVISRSAFALYRAGTDTTQATIRSFLLAMALYPEIQAKAYEEIHRTIGPDRIPTLDDIDSLPYVTAIVLESLRWNPPVATGLPHRVIQDDIYEGYFIPAGTAVIPNAWGMSQDPEAFGPNPSEFNPERYFNNPNPVLDPRDFVFGFGRRLCSGIHLAYRTVWITAAATLWAFEFKAAPGLKRPEEMDVTALMDLQLVSNPYPFECDFVPRHANLAERIAEVIAERHVE